MDPFTTFDNLRQAYLRYLDSPFWLRYQALRQERRQLLDQDRQLYREPMVEPLPPYTLSGFTVDQAAANLGVSPDVADFIAQGLFPNRERQVYQHQFEAWQDSLEGNKPAHRFPSDTVRNGWRITLPEWCQDQRNQMTGPADDGELCVKMLNSGAPGVMLDLEDSCVNEWSHHETGIDNIIECLRGKLTYFDKKRNRDVSIQPSNTLIFTRPRGLHLSQAGLGPQVASWINPDAKNQPVDAQQVGQAMGGGELANIAASLGVTPQAAAEFLAQHLPGAAAAHAYVPS